MNNHRLHRLPGLPAFKRRLAGGCSVILVVVATAVATNSAAVVRQQPALHLPPLDRVLPARVQALYGAVAPRVNTTVAMETRRMRLRW